MTNIFGGGFGNKSKSSFLCKSADGITSAPQFKTTINLWDRLDNSDQKPIVRVTNVNVFLKQIT